jgi:serine/threonine-protein kinase
MPALPPVGSLVGGKYRVVRLIGEGGMGAVYEAQHEHLGSRVALKFLLPELAEKPGLVGRFLQEARVSASIRSPYVTQVMDVDQTPEGAPYLVMELLEGESLEQRLARGSPLPMLDAVKIGVQILSALEAAHAHGVVHRDLKPDNVWLSPSPSGPHVKLLDFGIAKLKISSEFRQVETRPGSMMGTPAYMAPEQAISADQVDARADLYSFGVILYEMLAGSRPVDADDPATILEKLVRGEIHPLASKNASLPPGLCALVDRLVAPDPDERPASASYVRGELSRYIRSTQQSDRPSAVPPTVPPLDERAPPPFVTSQAAAVRSGTAFMPAPPVFGSTAVAAPAPLAPAPTAVATSPPVAITPPKKRGAAGAVVLTLFVVALAAGGAWAYMNPSIFDDTAPPPLPGPAPTTPATIGQIEPMPDPVPEVRPSRPAERPTAQVEPHAPPQSHPAPTSTQVGVPTVLPTFSLPSSLPFPLPSGLPPIFQQLPGFSPPPTQQPAPQTPAQPPSTQPTSTPQSGPTEAQPTSAPTEEPGHAPKPTEPHRRMPREPR